MKPLFPILIASMLLASCVTEKKRLKICRNCPTKIETVVKDSIVWRDSVVRLPGQTLTDTFRVECPDGGKPILKSRTKRNGKVELKIEQIDPNRFVNTCVVDSEAVYLKLKDRYRTVETTKETKIDDGGFDWWELIVSAGFLIALFLLVKFRRSNNQ